MPTRLFDHLDLRVRSVAAAKPFYDPFLRSLGLRGKGQPDGSIVYLRITGGAIHEAIALLEDPAHRPNATRVAFAAEGLGIVDRIAATLRACGAKAIAVFSETPKGIDLKSSANSNGGSSIRKQGAVASLGSIIHAA